MEAARYVVIRYSYWMSFQDGHRSFFRESASVLMGGEWAADHHVKTCSGARRAVMAEIKRRKCSRCTGYQIIDVQTVHHVPCADYAF